MKRFNRILAALLVALILYGARPTVAEMDVELNLNEQENLGDVESEFVPKSGEDEPNDILELDDIDFPALNQQIEIEGDFLSNGTKTYGAEPVQLNAGNTDFMIDRNGVLKKYNGPGGDVIIPNSVTSIGEDAFRWCYSLTSVTIPNSVTSIRNGAFADCDSLTSITIPNTVTSIGEDAFYDCESLTSVTLPNNITSISEGTFSYCPSLDGVIIPSGVTSIRRLAFADCDSLTSVTILAKTIDIEEDAFLDSSPTFHIISGSDAIDSVEIDDNYDIIRHGLSEKTLKLVPGKTHQLNIYDIGKKVRNISWYSSDNNIASVDNGKVTAKKIGKCTITAKLDNNKSRYLTYKTFKCKLTVTDPATISKTSLTLLVGKTSTLKVSGVKGRKVTWTSSNRKVATVDCGKVKAVAVGKCKIIAKVGNIKLTCSVTVSKLLTGDIHSILGKNRNSINKLLPDKLRYYEDDAYTNDYFLVQTDDTDDIISIALLTDAESDIGKYTLYGLYPGMNYKKACNLLTKKGWKQDSESYDESYFYNPKNTDVSFYVTIIDDEIDLIVYMYT